MYPACDPSCRIGRKLQGRDLDALSEALSDTFNNVTGAPSLNSIHKRTRIRKNDLIAHRETCLGLKTTPIPRVLPDVEPVHVPVRADPVPSEPVEKIEVPVKTYILPYEGILRDEEIATRKRRLEAEDLETRAVALRVRSKSYPEIAAELGVDQVAAYEAVERVMMRNREKADSMASFARQIDLDRIDRLLACVWERATDPDLQRVEEIDDQGRVIRMYEGQDKAIDRIVKLLERRAKLLGLDSPTGPATVVNVLNVAQSQEFQTLMRLVLTALAPWPEAKAAALSAVREELAARMATPA